MINKEEHSDEHSMLSMDALMYAMNAVDAQMYAMYAVDALMYAMYALDAPRARAHDGVHSRTCAFMRVHFNPHLNVTITSGWCSTQHRFCEVKVVIR